MLLRKTVSETSVKSRRCTKPLFGTPSCAVGTSFARRTGKGPEKGICVSVYVCMHDPLKHSPCVMRRSSTRSQDPTQIYSGFLLVQFKFYSSPDQR